jgi:hypothetical protein
VKKDITTVRKDLTMKKREENINLVGFGTWRG